MHPFTNDEIEFQIPIETADLGGENVKVFTYNVTESGSVTRVSNDSSEHQVKIRVTDNGNGVMSVKIIEGDTDMEFNNVCLSLLPGTGGTGTGAFLLTGLLIMAMGTSLLILKKRQIA